MVAPANKTFTGSGTVTGSGNIMGNPVQTFARSYSLSTANYNDNNLMAFFGANDLIFTSGPYPQYILDYLPDGVPTYITVSGLINGDEAMNSQTFQVMRNGTTINQTDNSFVAFLNTFSLNGHYAYEKYDHIWNWNS